MGKKSSKIKLKPGANIGEPAAEEDHRYLSACFVEHPLVQALKEVGSTQAVLLGRTGAGKSAILWHLANTMPNVSILDPKEVAFEYVGNSAIIGQLSEIGVDLHQLYEYLWMHIITLHIVKECLNATQHDGLSGILKSIKNRVWKNPKREIAVSYLEKHANTFWLNVEQVSTEITEGISSKLGAEVGLTGLAFRGRVEAGDTWKDEQKKVFKHRAQEFVSAIQMRELKETIDALAECMDEEKHYYVLIDDLDRGWAGNDEVQYSLIRALIDCLKTFRRIPNLKIIVAMREDLYESTVRTTTNKHFQAEKQQGIIRRLRWSNDDLLLIVERRLRELFKHAYTKQNIVIEDVLASNVNKGQMRAYLLEHTLRRPRDMIAFVNRVLADNEGEQLPLPARCVTQAEPAHSADRLRALQDEWRSCHPLIKTYLSVLHGMSGSLSLADLDEEQLFSVLYEARDLQRKPFDEIERCALALYDRNKEQQVIRLSRNLVACLYKVGAIGVKVGAGARYSYCYEDRTSLDEAEIGEGAHFMVHPMVASALGCQPSRSQAA